MSMIGALCSVCEFVRVTHSYTHFSPGQIDRIYPPRDQIRCFPLTLLYFVSLVLVFALRSQTKFHGEAGLNVEAHSGWLIGKERKETGSLEEGSC